MLSKESLARDFRHRKIWSDMSTPSADLDEMMALCLRNLLRLSPHPTHTSSILTF